MQMDAQSGPVAPARIRGLADLSDDDVLALVADGDRRALAELYDRLAGVAYGLARRVLRDEALAEDAVQDAFLQVWRAAGRFESARGSARAWILTLVHRRAVDLVRREQRRRGEPLEPADVEDPAATDAPWLRLERERVRRALDKLAPLQRQVLELAYWGGLTQSEIAERLGEPLGTIKSRAFTGLTRLRELLDDPEATTWTETQSTS
jgi:RNA polymerase sigma-70 factor (ECF subfamily)